MQQQQITSAIQAATANNVSNTGSKTEASVTQQQ
jgi:hypothetical protein